MKKMQMSMVILSLTLAAGLAWAAPATKPATSANAPASTPASATAKDEPGAPAALVSAAQESLVRVSIYFKKDTAEGAGRDTWPTLRARLVEKLIDDKIPLDAVGVAIAPDTVAIYDNGLEDRFIDRIEVETNTGQHFAAVRDKLMLKASLETLKITGPASGPAAAPAGTTLTPLAFVDPGALTLKSSLWSAGMVREGDRWRVTCASLSSSMLPEPGQADNPVYANPGDQPEKEHYDISDTSGMNTIQIIADRQGRPVGVCADRLFDGRQELCTWKGADLLKGESLSAPALARDRDQLRRQLLKSVHEVKVKFRQGSRETAGDREADALDGREISMYCLAISPRQAIIPRPLTRKVAAKIERMYVKYDATNQAPCRFVGAYKEFGGFLIELTRSDFPGFAAVASADPQRMTPLWAVAPREKDGKTDVDVVLARLTERRRGYGNRFHWVPARFIPPGTFLMDMSGKLSGVHTRQRVENEEQHELADDNDRLLARQGVGVQNRLFVISELKPALDAPATAMDANIKVLPKAQAKRRHWLGVEYVAMTKDLAEQMKLEQQTKDGTVGFLVSAVYDGSPAAKMGMAVGDVLLAMRVEGQPYPVDLKSALARQDGRGGDDMEEPEGREGPPPRTWKSQANFITRVLDAIGEGKTVEVVYWSANAQRVAGASPAAASKPTPVNPPVIDIGLTKPPTTAPATTPTAVAPAGAVVSKTFTVAIAPPDFDSAARWKNRKIGLTIKDLTFEVRKALSLPAEAPGVVVSKVEHGSPANIARIWENEIVIKADEDAVKSAEQLKSIIAAAAKAGKDKVRLTILHLGKTRFADLTVKAYDAADDEGEEAEE